MVTLLMANIFRGLALKKSLAKCLREEFGGISFKRLSFDVNIFT